MVHKGGREVWERQEIENTEGHASRAATTPCGGGDNGGKRVVVGGARCGGGGTPPRIQP